MTAFCATIFTTGITLTGGQRFFMMWPLCLSVALVYKATRCDHIRELPKAALGLWITIVLGMYAVGVGLWLAFQVAV